MHRLVHGAPHGRPGESGPYWVRHCTGPAGARQWMSGWPACRVPVTD
ncbi:hypothetical protein C4K16_3204 [Pseudomonas chlororaphis subsp. aurantiaca]|nr:hypothetical protein C4K16_3204 [Pseudomonas chlororaphis subsp. aurantiaca]